MIKVSIVIPVYNSENTIQNTLKSISSQTYEDFEAIIIDDGSTDNSSEVCQKYIQDDNRFILITQRNEGVSAARNKGMERARGQYVMFVDSDDELPNDALQILMMEEKQKENVLVCGSFRFLKSWKRTQDMVYENRKYISDDYSANIFNILNLISYAPWAKIFSLEIIRKNNIMFPMGVPCGEDGIFLLNYLSCISGIATTNKLVYYYNYKNNHSLVKKYYSNNNYYMRMQADMKIKCCTSICNDPHIAEIETDYLGKCIKYYTARENNYQLLLEKIKESYRLFPNAKIDTRLEAMANENDWTGFLEVEKSINKKYYLIRKIKSIFNNLGGK